MEIGVLLVSLALVFLTSFFISVLGTGTFFSLLGISLLLGGTIFYAKDISFRLRKKFLELSKERPAPTFKLRPFPK